MSDLPTIDFLQARLNRGPYCFFVEEDGGYCGRAKRWGGHGSPSFHEFVPHDPRITESDMKKLAEATSIPPDVRAKMDADREAPGASP